MQRDLDTLPLRLFALGELRLEGATTRLSSRRKQLALLVFLVRRGERGASRAELGTLLWGERQEEKARQSLRQALVELRLMLGDALDVGPNRIRISAGVVVLDVVDFENAATAQQADRAIDLWRGRFLQDAEALGSESYRDWIEAERRALDERFRTLLDQASRACQNTADWQRAANYARYWVELDPYSEAAVLRLCEALRQDGRVGEARAALSAFRERVSEFAATPSAELLQLSAMLETAPPVSGVRQSSAAVFAPDLVGRNSVLEDLTAAWQAAARGAVVVLIESDVGLGKTRICDEFVRSLGSVQPFVLLRAYAESEAPPGAAAAAALGALRTAPGLSGAADAELAEVARLVPTIRERFPALPPASNRPGALGSACVQVIRDVAAETRVLLLIDNIDRADEFSRQLILQIASEVSEPGLLVLCTAGDAAAEPREVGALRMLSRTRRIRLDALDSDATSALVQSMLGSLNDNLRSFCRTLHSETGGNPLFVREILLGLVDENHLRVDARGTWALDSEVGSGTYRLPATVRQTIDRRLHQLGDREQHIVAAAAAGAETVDAIADRTGLDRPALRNALDLLIARRILRRLSPAAPTYVFTHELIRRVAAETLSHKGNGVAELPAARQRSRYDRMRWPAAVAAVVVFIAGLFYLTTERGNAALPAPHIVAVFPFEVRTDSALAYLGDQLVDLISMNLDHAGDVRAIAPRTIFSAVGDAAPATSALSHIARRLGAGRFVNGSVILEGDQLRITGYITDVTQPNLAPIAETVEGPPDSAFALAARLSVALLARLQGGLLTDVIQSQADSTPLPALRAHLRGESDYRAARYGDAVAAFREAIAADSTFALAYYRLAMAAEYIVDDSLALWSAQQAVRHGGDLPDRPRRLVEGFLAWREGDADRAERVYREALRQYPQDPEALYNLGEVLFHLNPLRGRSLLEARLPFEALLATEPANGTATSHLHRIAVAFRDSVAERALMSRGDRVRQPDPIWLVGYAGKRETDSLLIAYKAIPGVDLATLVTRTAIYTRNIQQVERFAALLRSEERTKPEREAGLLYSAALAAASGQFTRALDLLEQIDPDEGLPYQALMAAAPHAQHTRATLVSLRARIQTWQPTAPLRIDLYHQPFSPRIAPALREYLTGRLSIALGDLEAARAAEQSLARLNGLTPEAEMLRRMYRTGLQAGIAWREGRLDQALVILQTQTNAVPPNLTAHAFGSQAFERFIRARALQTANRSREALGWYASLSENSIHDLIYRAPAALQQAEIHLTQREPAAARINLELLGQLWQNADPPLRAQAVNARDRAAQLQQ